jgi:hypothetical protein
MITLHKGDNKDDYDNNNNNNNNNKELYKIYHEKFIKLNELSTATEEIQLCVTEPSRNHI